jgi:hypothetical protein
VLEFDHVGEKENDVAALLNSGVSRAAMKAEVMQCDTVCANCHRLRTARRGGWARQAEATKDGNRPRRQRNVRWVYERLRGSACCDCGNADPLLLDYDHVGSKRAGVMTLAWQEYGIPALEAEIAECEVRCCNCHRRRTAVDQGWYRTRAVTLDHPPL